MSRIKVRQVLRDIEGIEVPPDVKLTDHPGAMKVIERWAVDCIVPACCDECEDVEPDGECEHGHPSALRALGLI